ncbi:MAG: hypothetical protein HY823_05515 [Acidobacteria bacterium]|nr:hypothetical protein [Acidobacteriota bacterium]
MGDTGSVDILTLEFFGVTASQALRELQRALEEHPSLPLRVMGDGEMVLHNVRRHLEKKGRPFRPMAADPKAWRVDVEPGEAPAGPLPARPTVRPVLLLRSAFAPGDRALGRRLLQGVLAGLPEGTPWLCLAHEALELLEDPAALAILQRLEAVGIPVRVSRESAAYHRLESGFPVMADEEWQGLAGQGGLTVL